MLLKSFFENVEIQDPNVLKINDSELLNLNKMYGMPRNFIVEAMQNLRNATRKMKFIEGYWEALREECRKVERCLVNDSFLTYFTAEFSSDLDYKYDFETMIIIADTYKNVEEMILANQQKRIILVLLVEKEGTKYDGIDCLCIEKFYSIAQIMYIVRPYITSKYISFYYNENFLIKCSYKQINNISGVDLFETISYQLKFLNQYVGMKVENRVQLNAKYDEETWIYDKLLYDKLEGIKKESNNNGIGFYNYEGNICPEYLNSPHVWVGEHFKKAIVSLLEESVYRGIVIDNCNINNIDKFDTIVFWDCPPLEDSLLEMSLKMGKKIILYATESVGINSCNDRSRNYYLFDKVGTWRKNELHSEKIGMIKPVYFEYTETNNEKTNKINNKINNKFVLIGSIFWKKSSSYGLYKEREKIILWMEKNHFEELDFYGKNTEETKNGYRSYKGEVKDKLEILSKYKYCICYENNNGYEGYVTEKIYDCIAARCVPIYWGAPDIEKYVPAECFINARKFDSFEQIYEFVTSLSETQWNGYINSIEKFIDLNGFEAYSGISMLNDILALYSFL